VHDLRKRAHRFAPPPNVCLSAQPHFVVGAAPISRETSRHLAPKAWPPAALTIGGGFISLTRFEHILSQVLLGSVSIEICETICQACPRRMELWPKRIRRSIRSMDLQGSDERVSARRQKLRPFLNRAVGVRDASTPPRQASYPNSNIRIATFRDDSWNLLTRRTGGGVPRGRPAGPPGGSIRSRARECWWTVMNAVIKHGPRCSATRTWSASAP
jgi:hypothetical protein